MSGELLPRLQLGTVLALNGELHLLTDIMTGIGSWCLGRFAGTEVQVFYTVTLVRGLGAVIRPEVWRRWRIVDDTHCAELEAAYRLGGRAAARALWAELSHE